MYVDYHRFTSRGFLSLCCGTIIDCFYVGTDNRLGYLCYGTFLLMFYKLQLLDFLSELFVLLYAFTRKNIGILKEFHGSLN